MGSKYVNLPKNASVFAILDLQLFNRSIEHRCSDIASLNVLHIGFFQVRRTRDM
jgi:hypothetical protein